MTLFKGIGAVLFAGAYVYFAATQYWTLAARPPVRPEGQGGGIEIPSFGLGTWLSEPDKVAHAVEFALTSGYNHVDAALIYSLFISRLRHGWMKLTSYRKRKSDRKGNKSGRLTP